MAQKPMKEQYRAPNHRKEKAQAHAKESEVTALLESPACLAEVRLTTSSNNTNGKSSAL